MGTDSKTAVQPPSSKVTIVTSSSSSSKNIKKKKSKSNHHKTKHNKQQRSESSSSRSSNDHDREKSSSLSKRTNKNKNSRDKPKVSSSNETRPIEKKSSNNKKKSHRSKHDSSESPPKRSNTTRSRSRSRSDRSSDRSSSRESPSRYRHKNYLRRPGSNMQNVYSPMVNFPGNMPRHHAPGSVRGGRMPYMPPGMMGGPMMRNNNGNRRSGGNSPPQSLLGGYRPPPGNFRGRGGRITDPAYVHKMANMLNLFQQQQQQQQQQKGKPGSNKQQFYNQNNPYNRFYQQFKDNYDKISQGQKVSNLYQASFPVQHIPREMRFNFRLLGRNIFTASDEEEEEKEKEKAAAGSEKQRPKRRQSSSSSSDSRSDDDRRKRRDDDDDDDSDDDKSSNNKSKSSPSNKTSSHEQKRSNKNNRNRTASSTAHHAKAMPPSHELLADPTNFSTFIAGIMQGENPEVLATTLASAAAAVNSKRERTKKQQDKKVQKFKNYARFQQIQATAGGVVPATDPEEVEKKIHGLARRLQMKTIGLHDDYESQGIKRLDESSGESGDERRHRSSGSSSDRSKDKDAGSDASTNSQRQRKLKKGNKRTRKMNAAGQLVGSSDSDQHRSDGNDSDGSMLNLNEDLKSIGYYIKDRERMLNEMFRCVRGHKLQAILPDALKTRSLDEIKAKCLDQLDILSKKRIRAILLAQPMTSSSGTEDSTDEDEQDFFTLYPHLKSSLEPPATNVTPTTNTNAATTISPVENNKKSVTNSKFRPVQMQAVNETGTTAFQSTLAAPVVVGGDEDVNDYYEGIKQIKKLANLRRNEQDDEYLPFPDQSGKIFQPIGSSLPKFEFKPITGLTHSQQIHLNARRAAYRQQQQQQQIDVRKEIDDLLSIDDFVLPEGERPLSSAQLSNSEQRRFGLPPRLQRKIPAGPPKKGSLGDLLKQKPKPSGERSPSPVINENSRRRRRRRTRSLSSTGSGQSSRSSSVSRHSSREITPVNEEKKSDEINDMDDLSKILDLNEEDELLLLQIEVEQEERNIRREEKRRRKEEKKTKKFNKKSKHSLDRNEYSIVRQCLNDLIEKILFQEEKSRSTKRTLNDSNNDLVKKIKRDETN